MTAIPVSAATGEEPSVYLTVRQDEGEVVALIGLTAAEPVASVQLTLEYDDNPARSKKRGIFRRITAEC